MIFLSGNGAAPKKKDASRFATIDLAYITKIAFIGPSCLFPAGCKKKESICTYIIAHARAGITR
jgi:hypothetical protein